MRTAFVIYEGMTTMDFIGCFDALVRLKTMGFQPDYSWDVCALAPSIVDGAGLQLGPGRIAPDLGEYRLLVLPGGGHAVEKLMSDAAFMGWLRTFDYATGVAASVCSGSLFLGALGVLQGKRATTHRNLYGRLKGMCREVVDARVVDESSVVTARGVTSSLYLGLHLCRRIAGDDVARKIATQMDADFIFRTVEP